MNNPKFKVGNKVKINCFDFDVFGVIREIHPSSGMLGAHGEKYYYKVVPNNDYYWESNLTLIKTKRVVTERLP